MGHREDLLSAASRLLLEKGYARTTARDLVAASGTNLASIGYHFGSKAALLNAAMEIASDDWIAQLATVAMAKPSAPPARRAAATWAALLDSLAEHRHLVVAFVEALAQAEHVPEVQDRLSHLYQRCREQVAHLVAISLGDGLQVDDPRCRAIASFVIAVCDGLSVQWLIDPANAPDSRTLLDGLSMAGKASQPDHAGRS